MPRHMCDFLNTDQLAPHTHIALARELADIILICEESSLATAFPSMECNFWIFMHFLFRLWRYSRLLSNWKIFGRKHAPPCSFALYCQVGTTNIDASKRQLIHIFSRPKLYHLLAFNREIKNISGQQLPAWVPKRCRSHHKGCFCCKILVRIDWEL